MRLRVATSAGEFSAWDRYVEAHPAGTPFHLSLWRNVVEKTFGHEPLCAYVEDGGRVRGVLPLFHVRSLLFGRSLVSVPLGVYGGICSDGPEATAELLAYARGEAERLGVRYLELRQREPIGGGLHSRDLYVTFERGIDGDPEKNMAAIPRNQRHSIRQGQKAGLASHVGGAELLPGFYDVYAHSVRNLGTPVFPRRLFEQILAEFGDSCRILTVSRDGRLLAGVLTLFFRDRVMPYYGGSLRSARPYAANDFMYWELMRYAVGRGYRVFDFGRSKRDSGSYHFKRHWGFEPRPLAYEYHLVRQKAVPDTSPLNPRFRLAVGVWKRLPLSVTKLIGPWLARALP